MLKYFVTVFIIVRMTFSLIIPKYDPCGYVGTSTSKTLAEICLKANKDCCYSKIICDKQDYFVCFNKYKMYEFTEIFNISEAFISYIDSDLIDTLKHTIISKCNNTDGGFIVTPEPRGFHIFRRRLEEESYINYYINHKWSELKNYFDIDGESFYDDIWLIGERIFSNFLNIF